MLFTISSQWNANLALAKTWFLVIGYFGFSCVTVTRKMFQSHFSSLFCSTEIYLRDSNHKLLCDLSLSTKATSQLALNVYTVTTSTGGSHKPSITSMNPSVDALWLPAVYSATFRERDSRNWKLLKGLTFYFAPLARGDEEDTLLTSKGSEKWGGNMMCVTWV